jgi:hypothetical protein
VKEQIGSIIALQNAMVAEAESTFLTTELDDIRCLIRLSTEFAQYLHHLETGQQWGPEWPSGSDSSQLAAEYLADSVFAGITSFQSVAQAYRLLVGAHPTTLTFDESLNMNIRHEYLARYKQLLIETNFERRCRLLLDLFKLQILCAGLIYR